LFRKKDGYEPVILHGILKIDVLHRDNANMQRSELFTLSLYGTKFSAPWHMWTEIVEWCKYVLALVGVAASGRTRCRDQRKDEMQRSNEITANQNLTASNAKGSDTTVARIYEPNATEDQTRITLRNRETNRQAGGHENRERDLLQGEEQGGTGY
jgi:hypothetical protein